MLLSEAEFGHLKGNCDNQSLWFFFVFNRCKFVEKWPVVSVIPSCRTVPEFPKFQPEFHPAFLHHVSDCFALRSVLLWPHSWPSAPSSRKRFITSSDYFIRFRFFRFSQFFRTPSPARASSTTSPRN